MAYDGDKRRAYQRERYHRQKKGLVKQGRPRMVMLSLRVPDTWLAQFQRMVAEAIALGNAPWKTTQEVVRALISEGFDGLKNRQQSIGEFVPQLELQQQLEGMDRARTTAQQMAGMAKANVNGMLDIGEERAALQYFSSALSKANELPPTVWSAWLIKEIRAAFPLLAKEHDNERVPGVRLGTSRPKEKRPTARR